MYMSFCQLMFSLFSYSFSILHCVFTLLLTRECLLNFIVWVEVSPFYLIEIPSYILSSFLFLFFSLVFLFLRLQADHREKRSRLNWTWTICELNNQVLMLYPFHCSLSAAESLKKLEAHLGDQAQTQRTVEKLFAPFETGCLSSKDDPREGHSRTVKSDGSSPKGHQRSTQVKTEWMAPSAQQDLSTLSHQDPSSSLVLLGSIVWMPHPTCLTWPLVISGSSLRSRLTCMENSMLCDQGSEKKMISVLKTWSTDCKVHWCMWRLFAGVENE